MTDDAKPYTTEAELDAALDVLIDAKGELYDATEQCILHDWDNNRWKEEKSKWDAIVGDIEARIVATARAFVRSLSEQRAPNAEGRA